MIRQVKDLAINGRFLSQQTTGVQRVARELTRAVDQLMLTGEHDGRVRLICEEGADMGDLDLSRIELHVARGRRGHAWEQSTLPMAQKRSTLLCLGNTAPLVSLLRQRTAVLIHDLSYRLFPQAYSQRYRLAHRAMLPMILHYADPIITVSESERAMLSGIAPAAKSRLVVAQNGSWHNDATDRDGSDHPLEARRYLLYVGSFSPRKNFARVLEVAIRLAREDGWATWIVGSPSHILRSPSIDIPSDVADRIRVVGQVEQTERLATIYAGARCLLFPSFYEASPLPPIEAMNFGCPVVTSELPSIRERCGDAVAYCDPASTDSIMSTVRRVLGDIDFAKLLVQRGRSRSASFSWRAQARAILAAIERASASR